MQANNEVYGHCVIDIKIIDNFLKIMAVKAQGIIQQL